MTSTLHRDVILDHHLQPQRAMPESNHHQAGKRHGMIKRTPKQIRQKRKAVVLCDADARIAKKYMPYAR